VPRSSLNSPLSIRNRAIKAMTGSSDDSPSSIQKGCTTSPGYEHMVPDITISSFEVVVIRAEIISNESFLPIKQLLLEVNDNEEEPRNYNTPGGATFPPTFSSGQN
jgi:hypothetical protein